MRREAYRKTQHQIDELFIGDVDYSVRFIVHWELSEDFDGKALGYEIDTIEILSVKRFEADPVLGVAAYADHEADESLRKQIDDAIRDQERRYGYVTDDASDAWGDDDDPDLDD